MDFTRMFTTLFQLYLFVALVVPGVYLLVRYFVGWLRGEWDDDGEPSQEEGGEWGE